VLACLACVFPAVASAQGTDHLLSANNLSRVSPHVWMIKGAT
jgi:hypothetical protein